MIRKASPCILFVKYIRNKQIMMALATFLLILSAGVSAAPGNDNTEATALQPITVTGTVAYQDNEPLPGVYVVIEGTNTGVVTDANGKFSIQVPNADASLVFSYVGFNSETVAVAGKSVINITMIPDITSLEEVVVIGYGTAKRLDVSGSIVSTNSKVIGEVPSTNATSALQGRLPGIEMSQVSTRPGADMQIRIRGERSLSGDNDPLIVVDGIPFQGKMNDIAPSDIKNIDILKDASATAIYGSRGANGVILVTTFRGVSNAAPSITYNGYYGVKTVAKKYPVYNGNEFQDFKNATINTTYKDQYTPLELEMIAAGKETDWQDLMYDNAMVTNHDLSISTGGERGAYTIGAGYYNETAVLPGQEYKRYSVRTAIDQEIGKFLKVGLSSQNAYSLTDGESASIMNNILTLSPLMPAYNDDGSIRIEPTEGHVDKYYNPLLLNNEDSWRETRKRFSTFNSLYGEIKFTPWLKYRLNLGLSFYQENYGNFYGSVTPFKAGSESSASNENRHFTSWTAEHLLYFDKVLAEKHRVNATLMYSAEQSEYTKTNMGANNLNADYLFWYNLGLADGTKTITAGDQIYSKKGLLSYMGRLMYSFDDRYSFTATYRRDGASVLADGEKWHGYSAFSAGWNISNENFMQNVSAISLLKLRLGYGQTSNQAIDPYQTLGLLSQVPYNFGNTNIYGAYVTMLPNPNLGWEYTKNVNIGIDFGLLDSRITGYIDLYQQKTNDVLYQVALPSSSGVSRPVYQNIGNTQNRGIEFAVSAQVVKPQSTGGFGWDVDFNIYANRNEITKLQGGVSEDIGNGFFVGEPFNVIYDYVNEGIIQEDEAPYLGTYAAGKIKIADISGPAGVPDGQITGDDRKILGSSEPDFSGGITTRFNYKGFDLSVVTFFKSGGLLISTMHMPHTYLSTNNGRRNSIKVDYWTPENPGGKFPQPGNQAEAEQNDWGTTLGYYDASFWKFRTITLGYTLNSNLVSKVGGKDARIYVTCQNPFTLFSPYMKDGDGLDPEATGRGAQGATPTMTGGLTDRALTIGANTPPTRNFLVGLSVRF
ncbi:MAG: TonB-dependent receptor [Bacteroidales bacterium]